MTAPATSPPRRATTVARYFLGLAFFVFGLNGFLNFIPQPKEAMSAGATALMGGFMASGYMFPLIKGTELVAGLLLLANRYVTLGLAILTPVLVNIVLFHAVLAPSGVAVGAILFAIHLYLAWAYRAAYRPMLLAVVYPSQ